MRKEFWVEFMFDQLVALEANKRTPQKLPPPQAENRPKVSSDRDRPKRAKISVFWPKIAVFFADFFLNGQSLCSKKLSGKGGSPPPLNGQNPLKRFCRVPLELG